MSVTVACPRCKGEIAVALRGILSPDPSESWIDATPNAFSLRRHAGCFSPSGGGEPLPIGVAA